jgi:hypothetical protein
MHDRLYHSGPEYDEVLRKAAHHFFHDLSNILVDHLIVLIGRITDPPVTRGHRNLSISAMDEALKRESLLTTRIIELSERLHEYRKVLELARNKLVAHADLVSIMSDSALGAHTETEMRAFFENLQLYCDEVGNATGLGPSDFRHMPVEGDVIDLMSLLQDHFDPDFDCNVDRDTP